MGVLRLHNFPKIVLLQELHSSHDLSVLWSSKLSMYNCYFSHYTTASRGTGLLIHRSVDFNILQEIIDIQGRYVILKGVMYGCHVTVASVYAPSDTAENRDIFFDELIGTNLGNVHFLMGDFNSVLDSVKDRPFGSNGGDNEILKFEQDTNSTEAWRFINGEKIEYSYGKHPENGPFSRIDLCFVSTEAIGTVSDAKYYDHFGISDHKPLVVTIRLGENLIGNDFKKIKPGTISHEKFVKGFSNLWEGVKESFLNQIKQKIIHGNFVGSLKELLSELQGDCDFSKPIILQNLKIDGEWWDSFKVSIFKLGRKVQISNRVENITKYRGKLQEYTFSNGDKNVLKKEILQLLKDINKEDLFKAQIEQRKNFEKNSGAFFRIIKEDRKKSYLDKVYTNNGVVLSKRKDIMNHLVSKYENLFCQKRPFQGLGIFEKHVPKIEEDQNDGPITFDELKKVIFNISSDKCPGSDGIPIEFYKLNFKIIGPFMVELFNRICSFEGEFPKSWDTSILKLIPKEDKISFDTLRPLQLLNLDLKSLAGVWAYRMGEVSRAVINKYQTGGVKGRSIQDNTLLINLLLQHHKFQNKGGFFVPTDNTKAFDNILRDYLYETLTKYGFTEKTIHVIRKFYRNNKAKIIVNGFLSKQFDILNGIRQGCPLSALLYVLAVEPLSRAIFAAKEFIGFRLPNNIEVKLVQHLDDLNFFAQDEHSIKFAINLINQFGDISGSVLNMKKTCIIKIGESNGKYNIAGIPVLKNIVTTKVIGAKTVKVFEGEFAKVFGVYFSANIKSYIYKNWQVVYKKCTSAISKWQDVRLSLIGKVLVLNVKVIPKMFYMMQAIEPIKYWHERFISLFRRFIGTGSCAIPINILEWSKTQGGLGLTSITNKARSLRLRYVKNYLERLNVSELTPISSLIGYYLDIPVKSRYRPNMVHTGQICYGGRVKMIDRHNVRKNYFQYFLQDIVWYSGMEHKYLYIDNYSAKEYYIKLVEMSEEWVRREQRGFLKIDFLNLGRNDEKKLWSNVFLSSLATKIQAFNLRVVHDVLPTLEVIGGKSDKFRHKYCMYCLKVLNKEITEDTEHILINCTVAKSTWFVINDKLRQSHLDTINVNKNVIFYKLGVAKPQNHLISNVNWALWVNRCSNVYEDNINNHIAVTKKVIYSLKKNSRLDKTLLSVKIYNLTWIGLNQAIEAIE